MFELIIFSLLRASQLVVLGLGISLVFGILGFANFAHLTFGLLGAYLVYLLHVTLHVNLFLSIIACAALIGLFSIQIDHIVFRKLRNASSIALMITSLGVMLFLRNVVRAIWGTGDLTFGLPMFSPFKIFGASITPIQIGVILTAVLIMAGLHVLLRGTNLGIAMRATADNRSLADACGIPTEKVTAWTWFISTSCCVIGMVLVAVDTSLEPYLGWNLLLPTFCAVILGGIGNPYGTMLGALVLGLAENFGISLNFAPILNAGGIFHFGELLRLDPRYKLAISFALLIAVLFIRPSGTVSYTHLRAHET